MYLSDLLLEVNVLVGGWLILPEVSLRKGPFFREDPCQLHSQEGLLRAAPAAQETLRPVGSPLKAEG